MIGGSLLLILVAIVLLGVGLVRGSDPMLVGSIAASLLAATMLVVSARRAAASRIALPMDRDAAPFDRDGAPLPAADAPAAAAVPALAAAAGADAVFRSDQRVRGGDLAERLADPPDRLTYRRDEPDDPPDEFDDPPDEPAAEEITAADAARLAQMSIEVLVVDARPRYHLPECTHLTDRESEPLPVSEAVELGFTPCGLCRPGRALLAEASQV